MKIYFQIKRSQQFDNQHQVAIQSNTTQRSKQFDNQHQAASESTTTQRSKQRIKLALIILMNFRVYACYNNHRLSTYSCYVSLKKEMEMYYNDLRSESLEGFTDACKYSFAQFRTLEKILKAEKNDFSMEKIFSDAFDSMGDKRSSYKKMMNQVQFGSIKFTGQWSCSEIKRILKVLKEGTKRCKFFGKNGSINWVLVSLFIPGHCGQSCYDQYCRMKQLKLGESYGVDLESLTCIHHRYNRILQKAFTTDQKDNLIKRNVQRLENNELVTLTDACVLAYQMYYSPICLASKEVVFDCLKNKIWPFD